MKLLHEKIRQEGEVRGHNILKVDKFLNHQLDVDLLNEIGKEFKKKFSGENITKILTIEASGIAIAVIAAQYFNVPVVFAKKVPSQNLDAETYETDVYSFTKKKNYKIRVAKKFLSSDDSVLVIDDFLAEGRAAIGLRDLVNMSGGKVAGIGIVIEKGFQQGGKLIRESGENLVSLAIIDEMSEDGIKFR